MYGTRSRCVFVVFSNAGPGGPEVLDRWYREVHGPEAFAGGSFTALHRYEALGSYDARFLAIWEGAFTSRDEVRARMLGSGRRDRSGITPALSVVWSSFFFASGAGQTTAGPVGTLSLVEGTGRLAGVPPAGAAVYDYGDLVLYESRPGSDGAPAAWSGMGREGLAPHGPYRSIFEDPEAWPPTGSVAGGPWLSHWRPIGSLWADGRRAGLGEAMPGRTAEEAS